MSRIGSTIRSANRNAITPPKLIPPFHSTAASGMFPTEQTKETIATMGPINGPTIFDPTGSAAKKKACQNSLGTQAARAPAINRPRAMSIQIIVQSMTKKWLTEVKPLGVRVRARMDPSPPTDISIAACPSMRPNSPRSACCFASTIRCGVMTPRSITVSNATIIKPPANSAATNCHPTSTAKMMPSSMTRLVEAN